MTWNRNYTIGAIVVLVLALLVYGFWPSATPVTIERVTRDSLRVTVEEEGRTRLVEPYVVSAPSTGYLQRVPWSVGDSVKQDATLAQLATRPAPVLDARQFASAQAQVEAAQAGVEQAQAEADAASAAASYAREERERIERLHREGTASQQQLDAVRSDARQATARETAAQHAVERARQDLRAARTQVAQFETGDGALRIRAPVRTPIDGQIVEIHRKSAGIVSAGAPLLEVGNPDALEVVVDVLSSDAVRIEKGMPVELTQWGGRQALQGRVRRVEPVGQTEVSALGVEEQRVDVVVRFAAPPEERPGLGTGYRVVARFILWEQGDVLQVPQSALFRHDDGWAVFAVEDGHAQRRSVTLGHRSGLQAQVTSGLSAGDRVVTHPGTDLSDGDRVEER